MAVSDLPACWFIRQLQVPLAQSLVSNGDWQRPSFTCLPLKLSLSYPLIECIYLCIKFKWKSQVRLTDGQCDHVTGEQKHCTTQYKRESRANLAVGNLFCMTFTISLSLMAQIVILDAGVPENSQSGLLLYYKIVLLSRQIELSSLQRKRREREGHVL